MTDTPDRVDLANEPATQNETPTPNVSTPTSPSTEPGASGAQGEDEELEAQLAYENLKRRRAAKKRKRTIIIAVVALVCLIAAVVFVISQGGKEEDKEGSSKLLTSVARLDDFTTTVTANGATEPVSSHVVTPEVDGIIENLQVEEGKYVNAGDVLFTLKNEELDKGVRDAQASYAKAERAANAANAAVDDAYSAYNKAVDEYNNSQGEAEFDEATLRAAIKSAEEAYDSAREALVAEQEKVTEAQNKADKRTVRAPVSGTIVSMNAKNGMGVGSASGSSGSSGSSSSSALMQISDLSQMKVTVQVNEVDIANIKEGQEAKATFSALKDLELGAKVVRIASASSGTSSDSGGGSGGSGSVVTYAVDLVIPEPDANLKPGMTANVTIVTQSAPGSIIVPATAVHDGEQGKAVTVVTNEEKQETKEVPVEVVAENSSEAAVKGDVKDGDAVVISAGAGSEDDLASLDVAD